MKEPFLSVIELRAGNDVSQNEKHTAESLVSEYGALDVEMIINNFKKNYSYSQNYNM